MYKVVGVTIYPFRETTLYIGDGEPEWDNIPFESYQFIRLYMPSEDVFDLCVDDLSSKLDQHAQIVSGLRRAAWTTVDIYDDSKVLARHGDFALSHAGVFTRKIAEPLVEAPLGSLVAISFSRSGSWREVPIIRIFAKEHDVARCVYVNEDHLLHVLESLDDEWMITKMNGDEVKPKDIRAHFDTHMIISLMVRHIEQVTAYEERLQRGEYKITEDSW